MTFIADTMLGKLSRWLRILGYDTVYDKNATIEQIADMALNSDAAFLTRRTYFPIKTAIKNMVFIPHEKIEDQLKYIAERFNLNISGPFFTRCLNCNKEIVPVAKDKLQGKVPQRTFEGTNDFYLCPQCNKIYWHGTHYKNTLNKLARISILISEI
jgi:uncharacterized protein with PIN domain